MRIAVLLATAAIIAYSANFLLHIEGDASPNVLTAASWVAQGNADLDEYVGKAPFHVQYVAGHAYPGNPPGTALLTVVPVAVALAAGIAVDTYEFLAVLGKVAGVVTAGLSVAFVYAACARLARPVPALLATIGYAFGTTVWSVSAQQIWMHGPAQLFVALGLFLLLRDRGSPRAGLVLGLATMIRPVESFVAGVGLLAARRRGFLWRYVAWGLPAVAFLITYYVIAFGSFRQSYDEVAWTFPPPGPAGLLISPSRGLLVYSPFLIFAVVGFVMAWRTRADERSLFVRDASLATLGIYGVYSLFGAWWAGWAYGSRYLSDAQPLFALAVAYAIDQGALARLGARVIFGLSLAFAIVVHFAGASWYYFFWNGYHWDVTPNIDLTSYRVWDWSDPQWWFAVRQMLVDPGPTLVPAATGAALAAVLVIRAFTHATDWRPWGARREPVVRPS
jgi:hypothetical protein